MSDLLFAADLDNSKFRDGLDRLRTLVREKHNELIRDWANASDKWAEIDRVRDDRRARFANATLADRLDRAKRATDREDTSLLESLGGTGGRFRWMRGAGIAIATLAGTIYTAKKGLEEYAAASDDVAASVGRYKKAAEEARIETGRFFEASDAPGQLVAMVNARRELWTTVRELGQFVGTRGDLAAVHEYTEAVKMRDSVTRENRAHARLISLQNEQDATTAELRGDPIGAARARARAQYEQSVRAINELKDLSSSQRSTLIAGADRIRDLSVAKAVREEEERRLSALEDMRKVRSQRLHDEEEAEARRATDARRERDSIEAAREGWRIDSNRLEAQKLRLQGDEKAAAIATARVDLEEKLVKLEESKLPAREKSEMRQRILAVGAARMHALDEELSRPGRRFAPSLEPGAGGGTRGTIMAQVFSGGSITNSAREQTAELKQQTELLRQLVQQGESAVATFAP